MRLVTHSYCTKVTVHLLSKSCTLEGVAVFSLPFLTEAGVLGVLGGFIAFCSRIEHRL